MRYRAEAMQSAAIASPSGMMSILALEVPQVEEIVSKASEKGLLTVRRSIIYNLLSIYYIIYYL